MRERFTHQTLENNSIGTDTSKSCGIGRDNNLTCVTGRDSLPLTTHLSHLSRQEPQHRYMKRTHGPSLRTLSPVETKNCICVKRKAITWLSYLGSYDAIAPGVATGEDQLTVTTNHVTITICRHGMSCYSRSFSLEDMSFLGLPRVLASHHGGRMVSARQTRRVATQWPVKKIITVCSAA